MAAAATVDEGACPRGGATFYFFFSFTFFCRQEWMDGWVDGVRDCLRSVPVSTFMCKLFFLSLFLLKQLFPPSSSSSRNEPGE